MSRAAIELLARIDAVGIRLWVPGEFPQARLADASFSAVKAATVQLLLDDGLLDDTGAALVVAPRGAAALDAHPELRDRARRFYRDEALLAAEGVRSEQHKPRFPRQGARPT